MEIADAEALGLTPLTTEQFLCSPKHTLLKAQHSVFRVPWSNTGTLKSLKYNQLKHCCENNPGLVEATCSKNSSMELAVI